MAQEETDTTVAKRQARRAQIAPGTAAGVTETMVQSVVHAFYARIRADALLGPIFDGVIRGNWNTHLARMCDFWSSVLLMTGRYDGRPMPAHIRIDLGNGMGLTPAHFARWLDLFRITVRERCPPPAAALFEERARKIAGSLLRGVQLGRGNPKDLSIGG